jgi:hypothetical protein
MEPYSYVFHPGQRSILAEIYFPKRIAVQGTIYTALEEGLYVNYIRWYLTQKARRLRREMSAYPHWFDPNRYGENKKYPNKLAEAKARMKMCSQVFYGWSMYEVDGVFLKRITENGKVITDEERTQVIRLMFKFEDRRAEALAQKHHYPEVYRAILSFILAEYAHTDNYKIWAEPEFERFFQRHASFWSKKKEEFARKLYKRLAPKMAKWIVDCGLFIFGYLIREFWNRIVELNKNRGTPLEDEIWVASVFHLSINVMKPVQEKPKKVILGTESKKKGSPRGKQTSFSKKP